MEHSVRMWMSVMIWTTTLALKMHYVTTQWDLSFASVLLGMKLLSMAVGISMNVRTTSLAALTRCALTCLEVMNVHVLLGSMRKNRHVLTLMNVRPHHVTPWHTAGTPLVLIHVAVLWDSQEMVRGATMWMSAMHSAIHATIRPSVITARDHIYACVTLVS